MPPYISNGSTGLELLADMDDFSPANITSLPVETCLLPPSTDPEEADWVTAFWHPDKPATVVHIYDGTLSEGWFYLFSRVNNGPEYRHGKVRMI